METLPSGRRFGHRHQCHNQARPGFWAASQGVWESPG